VEYEFTTVFDVGLDHNAACSKDRTSLFTGKIAQLTEETGAAILGWLATGAAVLPTPPSPAPVDWKARAVVAKDKIKAIGVNEAQRARDLWQKHEGQWENLAVALEATLVEMQQ
jgi:hypothetical protein